MAGREQGLAWVEQEVQHGSEEDHGHPGVVVVVQRPHSLRLLVIRRSALELQVAAEEVDPGRMVGHKYCQGYDEVVQRDGGGQDVRSFRQRAEEHMVQLACHQEPHQPVHRFERHKPMLRDLRIAQKAVQKECFRRSMLQCELRPRLQVRPASAQRIEGDRSRRRSNGHLKLPGSLGF